MRAPALLDAVRGLHWPARRSSRSHVPGAHRSTRTGVSPEFSEYRLYRQGDDPRMLDWRLLARSDRAYVRLAVDRAGLPTTLVVDASASMAFPVATRAKWEMAAQVAIGLAAVAHGDGDPTGLLIPREYEPSVQLAARTRRGVLAEFDRLLDEVDPEGAAPLGPSIAAARTPRIAVISDLLGDAEAMLAGARLHMARGGEVFLVHVIAQDELDPPRRTLLAVDPELPDLHRLLDSGARDAYLRGFADWRTTTAAAWRGSGAAYTVATTDESPAAVVRRIVAGQHESLPGGADARRAASAP